ARRQVRQYVRTAVVGDDRSRSAGVSLSNGDGNAREHCSALVGHPAVHLGRRKLRPRIRTGGEQQQCDERETTRRLLHHVLLGTKTSSRRAGCANDTPEACRRQRGCACTTWV